MTQIKPPGAYPRHCPTVTEGWLQVSATLLWAVWLLVAASASGAGVAAEVASDANANLIVETNLGVVRGVPTPHGSAYKGLPFAAPPVGELRWRSPAPPAAWRGIRAADQFGPPCAQLPSRGRTAISAQGREDCLYLNVWTPEARAGRKFPVMVWIHGGAFANGMGSSPTYDGDQLAARGVVVVTLNYRLGVFGFLAHPELTAESARHTSGSFGLEDQLAALQWVRSNIANFGGDPGNVTIFGQSAGGASVLDLVTSTRALGLFRRAIVQSGASRGGMLSQSLAAAEEQGRAFAGALSIAQLRRLGTEAVLRRSGEAGSAGVRFAPVSESRPVGQGPGFAGRTADRPALEILIGSNSREGLSSPQAEEFEATLIAAFGSNVERARAIYRQGDGAAHPLLGTPAQQFATDSTFRCGNVEFAERSAAAGVPTWQYQFEQLVPGREALGAAHSFEVPYVFGNLSAVGFSAADYGPADRRLSTLMMEYWSNFARRGDPNGPGLPAWPRHSGGERQYLRLSSALTHDAEVASDLGRGICPLFVESN